LLLAVAGLAGAVSESAAVTAASRIGSIALMILLAVRIVRRRPVQLLPLVTLLSLMAAFFGGQLLDPIGVPGIWFPFGIGVSRTQYIYAFLIPMLAVLIVQTAFPASAGDPQLATKRAPKRSRRAAP
jgi:hypothetical protein